MKKAYLALVLGLGLAAASMTVYAGAETEADLPIEQATEEDFEVGEETIDYAALIAAELASIEGEYTYTESEVSCERDGLTLRGILALPDLPEGEKAPLVVLSHGFMADQSSMMVTAKYFAVSGIASVRFDLAGTGMSDGAFSDMSAVTEAEDIKAILAYCKTLDSVDTDHIFLSGMSQGGFATALAAPDVADEISGIILYFPALCIPDDLRAGHIQDVTFDPENIPEILDVHGFEVGSIYMTDCIEMDPYSLISAYKGDVLLFHGDADYLVPISYSEQAAEVYDSVQFHVIEGAGHGFFGEAMAKAMEISVAFVEEECQ